MMISSTEITIINIFPILMTIIKILLMMMTTFNILTTLMMILCTH